MKRKLYFILFILLVSALTYSFFTFLEWVPPTGKWENNSAYLGRNAVLSISAADKGQGLKKVKVTFVKGDKSALVYEEEYPKDSPPVKEKTFRIPLDFKKLGIDDGKGSLRIDIRDRSYWRLGKGNSVNLAYNVVVDTVPPQISILSADHVVRQGGSEVTVYKSSPDTVTTGVMIGEHFFPGYKGAFDDTDTYITFFSYPYNLAIGESVFITAKDRAGNAFRKSLPVLVKPSRFRKSTINLNNGFLKRKLPEVISFANLKETGSLIEDFILVNKKLREINEEKIFEITKKSMPEIMWKGGFIQLKNAQVESKFADFRSYKYNGKIVDKEYHLGYDLAVRKHYPINSSNSGEVVFAGNMGIYGNTVIIDHGFGIFTLYSHMSSMDVKIGDTVKKGEVIGKTGETGMAGGDHLHFGIYVSGVPVTPIEWWDKRWVYNRILRRIRFAVRD